MEDLVVLSRNSPSWVWDMVCAMNSDGRSLPRKPEYAAIREGVYFLRRYDTAGSFDLFSLENDYPDLYAAHELHTNPVGERWVLEAGLLTDLSFAELGDYIAQPKSVVKKYSETFYNIRHKLNARGYVLNHIFMPAVRQGMHGRDYDFLYKTLAYCLGWDVFRDFIDAKAMSDKSRTSLEASFRDRMVKLGWLAAHRLEVNNFNGPAILEQCLKLQELEQDKGPVAGQAEAHLVLQALLTNCKTTILPAGKELCLDEPRVDELLAGASYNKYIKPAIEVTP